MTKQTIVYIDGFNLYHAINDLGRPDLKWLDLWSLSSSLLRQNETLKAVKYFSAYATWLPGPYARHREYVKALEHQRVETIIGKFKDKPRQCKSCGASWISHEEKETDVHIGISMVADALRDEFDRAILISADSDLGPVLRMVKKYAPHKETFVAAPPGRYGNARDLGPKMVITKGRLAKHLLPGVLQDATGKVIATRPSDYDPPPPQTTTTK